MNEPVSRFRLYLSMLQYGNAHNRDFAKEHASFFSKMLGDLARLGVKDLEEKDILDVGCGKSYWLSLLLSGLNARVVGIDPEVVRAGMSPAKYWAILRRNGPERMARTLYWDAVFRRPYYATLATESGLSLDHSAVALRKSSVSQMDLPDNCMDLVVSHEVFEHLDDVPAAVRELRRVLRPDGLTYIYVHNFTSISGGHHIAWKYPDTEPSETVPAWDHLRENRFPQIPSWVNGMREHEYRQIFEQYFQIIDWIPGPREGETLLTPSIRTQLSNYSEQELLMKGFTVVARPLSL